jgi:hypothetical protein
MPKRRLDQKLLEKLREKTNKSEKYLREQISRRANRLGIASEAALVLYAKAEGIGTANYLRKLPSYIQDQIRSSLPAVFTVHERIPATTAAKKTPHHTQRSNIQLAVEYLLQDQELRERCQDLLKASGHFDRVFREATTVLDDRLKKIASIKRMKPLDVVGKSLNPDPQKAIIEVSTDRTEQEGFYSICKGLVLSFRDTTHHELSEKFTREDALKFCGFVDSILTVLKGAEVHPDRLSATIGPNTK